MDWVLKKKERRWVLNRYLIDVSAIKQPNHLYLYLLTVLNEWLLDYAFLCVRCLNSTDQAHGQEKGSSSLSHTHRRTVAHNYTSRRRVGYELALLFNHVTLSAWNPTLIDRGFNLSLCSAYSTLTLLCIHHHHPLSFRLSLMIYWRIWKTWVKTYRRQGR